MPRVPIVILKGKRDYASLPSLYILQKEDKSLFPCIGRLGTIPFSCTHIRNLTCKELQSIYMLNVFKQRWNTNFFNLECSYG